MTDDRIGEIRAYCNSGDYDRSTAVEDLMLKALDEREALLRALRELLSRVPLTDTELAARVTLGRAAIEKAEAP